MICQGCKIKADRQQERDAKAVHADAVKVYGPCTFDWYCPACFLLTEVGDLPDTSDVLMKKRGNERAS